MPLGFFFNMYAFLELVIHEVLKCSHIVFSTNDGYLAQKRSDSNTTNGYMLFVNFFQLVSESR